MNIEALMKFTIVLFCLGFVSTVCFAQKYPCLPPNLKEDSAVGPAKNHSSKDQHAITQITVAQVLKGLKARCSRGKLIDGGRKAITFYYLKGCWGNPPYDYLEILRRQNEELSKLKKKYTVVEMRCDAYGMPM